MINLSQTYRSPTIGVQSKRLGYYFINLALRKRIFDDRGSLTLSMQDIFDTRTIKYVNSGTGFQVRGFHKWQTRRITLALRYKIID